MNGDEQIRLVNSCACFAWGSFFNRDIVDGNEMSKERELLKRCADQLNSTLNGTTSMRLAEEIKELLAQPEQEPVAIDENTSDGYHTFKELYEFRKAYNVALFKMYQK